MTTRKKRHVGICRREVGSAKLGEPITELSNCDRFYRNALRRRSDFVKLGPARRRTAITTTASPVLERILSSPEEALTEKLHGIESDRA